MKKISLKIMLAIIICSIITSTILGVVSITQSSSVMNDTLKKTLSYASEKYANQLSIYFKNTEGLVEAVAANVTVTFEPEKMAVDPEYFKEYKSYLDRIIKETLNDSDIAYGLYFTFNPDLTYPTQEEVWYAFDENGIPRSIQADLALNSRDFSQPLEENLMYYFNPILKQKGTWTGPYVDPDVNFEMLSYSKAVYVDGVLIGVAGADILTDDTIDMVKTMKIYEGSSSFLFDEENNLVVSSQVSENKLYSNSEEQIKKHIESKVPGALHYFAFEREYVLVYSKLSNGWTMGITQPTQEVYSPARSLVMVLALLTTICILIAIIYGVYFARKLSKPILSASDQLKLLEMGEYTHAIPEEFLNRKDDLGEFHNAILAIQSEMKKEAESNRAKDILLIYQSKQAKLGEMVGNISHQWKQPLNTINLILMNLYDDYKHNELSEEEFKIGIDKLRNIVENMATTIKDFTDFLNPNRERSQFDLTESIHLALTLMEASLSHNKITVKLQVEEGIRIVGYQNEFSHVLFNILNNARDATMESSVPDKRITIRGYHEEEDVVVEICNTGDQIPEETMARLFEPYFTTKGDKDGTGIGLYISKIIMEQGMKGSIELKNMERGVCCRIRMKEMKDLEDMNDKNDITDMKEE